MKRFLFAFIVPLMFGTYTNADTYNRIVAAGGDITEIIYALGAQDRLIGVDSTSGYPALAVEKEQIGYVRSLSAEGILALSPDLLIGADDMGPPNVIDNIAGAGVEVARAPLGLGADRVTTKIEFVGQVLGLENASLQLSKTYRQQMEALNKRKESLDYSPKVLFFLSIREGAPIVGGQGTSANDIIALAGGRNMATAFEGWKPMNSESIIAAQPDLIIMTDSHAESLGGIKTILARSDVSLTPAGMAQNIVTMDAMLLLGFGPRTPQAVEQLLAIFEKMAP